MTFLSIPNGGFKDDVGIPSSVVPSLLHERMLLVWLSSRRLCHGDTVDNAKGLHGHVSQP